MVARVSYALFSNVFLVVFFLYPRAQFVFLRRLAGVRHMLLVVFLTPSLDWVGAPNEHAPFRVHDAVIDLVDQCLTRSRIADERVGVS